MSQEVLHAFDVTRVQADIAALAQERFAGRRVSTLGHNQAREWLVERMQDLSLHLVALPFTLTSPVVEVYAPLVVEVPGMTLPVVNPLTIQVMREVGIDISSQWSKSVRAYVDQPFDDVITVCDQAAEACPVFPGPVQRLYWSFPDPAAVTGSSEERLTAFRTVRDAIGQRLRAWPA